MTLVALCLVQVLTVNFTIAAVLKIAADSRNVQFSIVINVFRSFVIKTLSQIVSRSYTFIYYLLEVRREEY